MTTTETDHPGDGLQRVRNARRVTHRVSSVPALRAVQARP